jgi:hypothetical protein
MCLKVGAFVHYRILNLVEFHCIVSRFLFCDEIFFRSLLHLHIVLCVYVCAHMHIRIGYR